MKKAELKIWKEAQEGEFAFWEFRRGQGIILPSVSRDRYTKCLNLLRLRIGHSNRILDVGSGPYGIISFFFPESCLRVSLDPLIGEKEFQKEAVREPASVRGIAEYLPFIESTFEVIFCVNSLDHSYIPLAILNETRRVLKTTGYFFMMVHVVALKEKILHFVFHKTRLRGILFANSLIRFFTLSFFGLILDLTFGLNIVADGIRHPFYFTCDDVTDLLDRAGFATSKIRLHSSPWNYKKELFIVARKERSD